MERKKYFILFTSLEDLRNQIDMTVKRILKRKEPEKVVKRAKKQYVYKFYDEKAQTDTLLPIEALLYSLKDQSKSEKFIELKLQLKSPMTYERQFIPLIINIPNKLRTLAGTKVLLVTNDPVEAYKGLLEEGDHFTDIMGVKRFKTLLKDSKKAKELYKNVDLIMLDYRNRTKIRKLIEGTVLNKSNRRLPLLIQLTNPETDEVDVDHVIKQADSLCKNTSYVPATGKSISIVLAKTDHSSDLILENMDSILYQIKTKANTKIEKMFLVCGNTTLPIISDEDVEEEEVVVEEDN